MLNVSAWAEHESLPPDYPASLERQVAVLQSQIATSGETVPRLIAGAGLYLDIADDLFEDAPQKRLAYESAAEMAKRALQLEERNAQAHFLYAAALGSAERIKASPMPAWCWAKSKGMSVGRSNSIRTTRRRSK